MSATINEHGAWIMVVCQSHGEQQGMVRSFATVDAALKQIREWLGALDDAEGFESWSKCLATNKPGVIDCYDCVYPIVWYDPSLDDGQFEVDDYEEWEAAKAKSPGGVA